MMHIVHSPECKNTIINWSSMLGNESHEESNSVAQKVWFIFFEWPISNLNDFGMHYITAF